MSLLSVPDFVQAHKVTVVSKSDCTQCVMAKEELEKFSQLMDDMSELNVALVSCSVQPRSTYTWYVAEFVVSVYSTLLYALISSATSNESV